MQKSLGLLLVSIFVFATFFLPATAVFWQELDTSLFYALNGTLESNIYAQLFWSILSNRGFDIIIGLGFFSVYWHYFHQTDGSLAKKLAMFGFLLVWTICGAQISHNMGDIEFRQSPSLILEPFYSLQESYAWLKPKITSEGNFPADNGYIMLMLILFMWSQLGSGKKVLVLTAMFIVSVLSRMVAGAHWFSDIFVGSLGFACLYMAIALQFNVFDRVGRWGEKTKFFTFIANNLKFEQLPIMLKGIMMGIADLIPGISGGTMAYILGIYHRLIFAIKSFDKEWFYAVFTFKWRTIFSRPHWGFLLALLSGIMLAIVLFTKYIPLSYLLTHYPNYVYALFFGLILASVFVLLAETESVMKLDSLAYLGIGTFIGYTIVTLTPTTTPDALWFIFIAGMIAISAMLLPGISGSFILLILGKYAYILEAVGNFDVKIILIFICGCVVGVISFSRILSYILSRYFRPAMLTIAGFLLGSLYLVWPFQDRYYVTIMEKQKLLKSVPYLPQTIDQEVIILGSLMLIAMIIVFILNAYSKHLRKLDEL